MPNNEGGGDADLLTPWMMEKLELLDVSLISF
jgi:hypothetical protein